MAAVPVFDCDDTNPSINPAAEERCDDVDWNCADGPTEIEAIGCMEYHRDEDWDGYGAIDDYLCLCDISGEYRIPAGEVTLETDDCCDTEWGAKPGSDDWRNSRTDCGSWDWNCDDDIEAKWTENGYCGTLPTCDDVLFNAGWRMGGSTPLCGSWGTYLYDCDTTTTFGLPTGCSEDTESRQQECR